MKDMPARLAPNFRLLAVPPREDTADVLMTGGPDLARLRRGARLGTSSLRRRFEAARLRPDLDFQPLRGNIDTRIAKLHAGDFDAIILAAAGLKRLGQSDLPPAYRLPEDDFVPAGGQGALAIEAMSDRLPGGSAEIEHAVMAIDDLQARIEVSAERAFLAEVGASCASPIGVRAIAEDGRLTLNALLFSLDGSRSMVEQLTVALSSDIGDAKQVGVELARRMLARGAAELIGDRDQD